MLSTTFVTGADPPSLSRMGAAGCMRISCLDPAKSAAESAVRGESKPCRPPAPPSSPTIAARPYSRTSASARSIKRCSASCRPNTHAAATGPCQQDSHRRRGARLRRLYVARGRAAVDVPGRHGRLGDHSFRDLPRRMKEQYARAFRGGRHADAVALRATPIRWSRQFPCTGPSRSSARHARGFEPQGRCDAAAGL